ncbi:MAG: hypothetical protein KDK70_23400 [Myxococcales bacterium]|nr:hypothetical protein [Myxococcales bacterium]
MLQALVLSWVVPAACPDRAALESRLSSLLGPEGLSTPMTVSATVTEADEGFDAVVEFDDPPTLRALHAQSCGHLTDAIALLIAVHIDVVAVAEVTLTTVPPAPDGPPAPVEPLPVAPALPRSSSSEPAPSELARPEPAPPRRVTTPLHASSDRETEAPRRSRPRPDALLGVEGAIGSGPPRQLDGRLALTSAVEWPRARVEGRIEYGPPRTVAYPTDGVEGSFQRIGSSVLACRSLWEGRFVIHGCAGLSAHAIRGEGRSGLPAPTAGWAPWIAPTVAGRLAFWSRGRLGALVGVEGAYAVVRPRFTSGEPTVPDLRTAPGAVWVTLGLELRFSSRSIGGGDMGRAG